ncbi:S8 family serine peptidase [Hyalangium versicolor]|uniref:S8 family serine peptidase n=1 Tax=Hyalangium versicolor TaxID=2861190 RepID=UPI001CC91C57|nr:S8 family serine peptidase [Hyalangium versicolor]
MQLSAEQAKRLEQSGVSATLLGDYGSFKVIEVDDAALESLPEGAQSRDDLNDLLLNAGVIDTASAHGQSLRGMSVPVFGKRLHIVQFAGPIQEAWVQELEATGVKLITYIPNNAYIVHGDGPSLSRLQKHIPSARAIQWNGDYLNDYKLDPSIQTRQVPTYAIQLIQDEEANGPTLDLIRARQSRDGTIGKALGYVNVVAYLTVKDLYEIAARPDVLSIQPRSEPRKLDERQNIILTGQLTGNSPSAPGYLAWLASKGFTQAQFNASGFGVDLTDSGIDNGTTAPSHFGLYEGGNVGSASRIIYNRIEGAGGGSTQGCDGHGALNAHIIAGYANKTGAPFQDAAGYSYGLGVAPFVKLGGSVIFGPSYTSPVYEDLQSRAYRDGMRISSNSWGLSSDTNYSIDSQQYDSLVRDAQQAGHAEPNVPGNQEMVIVFSAGNDGPFAYTVVPPGTAKNVITVGASENVRPFGGADTCGLADTGADSANDIADFSARGPAWDERKKPDLVAPGTHISGGVPQAAGQRANPPANPLGQRLSCFNGDEVCGGPGDIVYPAGQEWYTASSGTSHSAPAVSGGAALVRQSFINQGMPPPSAAMTKAYLMNSARYLTGVGGNDTLWSTSQGMGAMDLGRALDNTPRQVEDESAANLFTSTGQTRTFNGVIADSTQPLRVTLAWTDAPGSTTGNAWNNNLDLAVTVGTSTYKGNVFTGASSVTGGTADDKNNVESVFLPAGTEGAYTVTVTAANINSDGVPGNASALDQDFALVVYNSCSTAPPSPPTGVTATANGNNRVDVSWAQNGAASYNIYRATTAGGPYTRVGTATAPPYADSTVSGSSTYYYVVRAVQCTESAKSSEVSVTPSGPPGPAVVYKLSGLPASVQAGTAAPFTLTAIDAVGINATGYNGTAVLTSSDPQAVLPASVTFSAGVATGAVSFQSLGSQTLTATDTSNTTLTGSGSTTVTVGPAAALVFLTQPTHTVAGAAILPSVQVGLVDQFGNAVSTGSPSISLALGNNPGGSTLSGTTTVTAINGVATFNNLSLNKVGAGYTLVASSQGFEGATSTAFSVTAGAATSYSLALVPSSTAGQELTLSATAHDAYGNLAADYGGTVKVTSSDTKASFAANARFVQGVFHDFKVTFKSPGLQTITVTDSEKNSLSATAQLTIMPVAEPTATVTEPAGGTVVSGNVTVSATGAVAQGTTLVKLAILVDGSEIASSSETVVKGTWDSSKAEPGSHVITAVITDGAGNVATSTPVIVTTEAIEGGSDDESGCGCGATSGMDASIYLGLLALARYALGQRRAKV